MPQQEKSMQALLYYDIYFRFFHSVMQLRKNSCSEIMICLDRSQNTLNSFLCFKCGRAMTLEVFFLLYKMTNYSLNIKYTYVLTNCKQLTSFINTFIVVQV